MLGTILAIYAVAGMSYWIFQFLRQVPTIFKWSLVILAVPVLLPVALVKSLPLYLKKEGKWYKYRWLVWFTLAMIVFDIVLFSLPE